MEHAFLEETVEPGLGHVHGPRFVRYVSHFDQHHAQLKEENDLNQDEPDGSDGPHDAGHVRRLMCARDPAANSMERHGRGGWTRGPFRIGDD